MPMSGTPFVSSKKFGAILLLVYFNGYRLIKVFDLKINYFATDIYSSTFYLILEPCLVSRLRYALKFRCTMGFNVLYRVESVLFQD